MRTAIAVMAFGFLVAKFDLFLKIAAQSLAVGGHAGAVPGASFGGEAGIVLILAGTLMVALATVRFLRTGQVIDSAEAHAGGARIDLALAGVMVVLGIALVLYLAHTIFTSIW